MSDELSEDQKTIQELRERILELEQQIDWFNRQLFGRKSERHRNAQHPDLFNPEDLGKPETSSEDEAPEEGEEERKTKMPKRPRRRQSRAQKLPAHLPERITYHDPQEVQTEPDKWRVLKEERRLRLGKVPGHFYRQIDIYRTWVPKDQHPGDKALIAKAPPTIVENGFWMSDLIAEILCNRYLYHLPYDRQQKLYNSRHGIDLPKQTMSDAARHVADQLKVFLSLMKRDMLAGGYLRADETKARYLDKQAPGGSSTGYFWLYKGLNGNVIFDWQLGRDHRYFFEWIGEDFQGVLGSDAYEAYLNYCIAQQLKDKDLQRAACLAHVRRKFEEALKQKPVLAKWFLKIFAQLYRIEATLRELKADDAAKSRYRQKHSRPLLKLLQKASLYIRDCNAGRPAGYLGKAVRYLLNQGEDLETFLDHGQVQIDNNGIERDVRPLAIGRKNWLFIGSPEAGERTAILLSFLISARHHGVDPEHYLRDLIERLPSCGSDEVSLRKLLPENWAASQREQLPQDQSLTKAA